MKSRCIAALIRTESAFQYKMSKALGACPRR
jgi:hypothetical protein